MLSKTAKYGLKAIMYMVQHKEASQKIFKVDELSKELGIPKYFLSKVLLDLTRKNLLSSMKGQNGGFYVLISLIISPLFAFILVLANGKTEEKQIEEKIKSKEMDDFVKHSTSNQNIQTSNGRYEQLEKIANLK